MFYPLRSPFWSSSSRLGASSLHFRALCAFPIILLDHAFLAPSLVFRLYPYYLTHNGYSVNDGLPLVAQMVKNPPSMWETWVQSLGWEDPLEEAWRPTPVFLPGEFPWTEEPGGLQSMRLQWVRHKWMTKHSTESPRLTTESVTVTLCNKGIFLCAKYIKYQDEVIHLNTMEKKCLVCQQFSWLWIAKCTEIY